MYRNVQHFQRCPLERNDYQKDCSVVIGGTLLVCRHFCNLFSSCVMSVRVVFSREVDEETGLVANNKDKVRTFCYTFENFCSVMSNFLCGSALVFFLQKTAHCRTYLHDFSSIYEFSLYIHALLFFSSARRLWRK